MQLPRGYLWASGEIRCASYNHYYTPNAPQYDCVANLSTPGQEQYTAVGFKAARSNHPGGVNWLMADGAVMRSIRRFGRRSALGLGTNRSALLTFDEGNCVTLCAVFRF